MESITDVPSKPVDLIVSTDLLKPLLLESSEQEVEKLGAAHQVTYHHKVHE